jgi:hypothetical protein
MIPTNVKSFSLNAFPFNEPPNSADRIILNAIKIMAQSGNRFSGPINSINYLKLNPTKMVSNIVRLLHRIEFRVEFWFEKYIKTIITTVDM